MVGQQILNYKIERLIGEGGMGKVYLASHTQLDRKVAIKVLHAHLTYSQEFRNRFKAEANLLASLNHPNIVTLYDYIENNDFLALIMEYVEGITMEDYIKKTGYVAESYLIPLFQMVLDAFQYAHEHGIIHRDIKPANIILQDLGEGVKVKILDFGIAKIKDSLSKTQTGTQMGTILYMSPEQVKGQKVDIRSDIYSLGVTLFELATGKMPYDPNSSIYEVSNAIVHQPLPKPRSIKPDLSLMIEKAILKATEKNPDLRFQNCLEFKNAITPQNLKSKSLLKSVSFWFFAILILVAIGFLAHQVYQNYNLKKGNSAQKDLLNSDNNVDIQYNDQEPHPTHNDKNQFSDNSSANQEEVSEKLPLRDLTNYEEGKKIQNIINFLIEKWNANQEDWIEYFDYQVAFDHQYLTPNEAYQKLRETLKMDIKEYEYQKVNYSVISNFKVFSYESNAREYLSFETKDLKIRKTIIADNLNETIFEDFNLKFIFKNYDFKISGIEF